MNHTPKVSVIVPVYNTADYVVRCLESIVAQTLTDIEILVIDDGSTDNSPEILKSFADKESRVEIRSRENSGLADTYNLGIELARGEYLAFIDSDDWIDPEALEKLYNRAIGADADLVLFRYRIFYEETNRRVDTKSLAGVLKNDGGSMTLDTCPELINISTSSCVKLFSRELVHKNQITYPSGLRYEDTPFCYKAYYYATNIVLLDECLYTYRIRSHSITAASNRSLFDHFKIFTIVDSFFREHQVGVSVQRLYARKRAFVLLLSFSRINTAFRRAFFEMLRDTIKQLPASEVRLPDLFARIQLYYVRKDRYQLFRAANWLKYNLQQKLIMWIKG